MDFLKRNSGKIALLAIIVFFTLPFIYSNEEEEDFSPFAVRSGMSYQSNPISKLANKIASFYGFSKPVFSETTASARGVDSIKDKVAGNHVFSKEDAFDPQVINGTNARASRSKKDDMLVASSRNFKNFDRDVLDFGDQSSPAYGSRNSFSGNSSTDVYNNAANNPVKGYVSINGKNYDVIEDFKGVKYVVTPKGHIPLSEIARRNVSEREFIAAKKRLANASDMEVLTALQQEKEKKAQLSNKNKQASSTGYRNGAATNMGGTNYARVSVQDRGFDDNVLSNAYEDLKNINLKVDGGGLSSSSAGGGYHSGMRDSFGGSSSSSSSGASAGSASTGANGGKATQGGGVFTPSGLVQDAKAKAQNEVAKVKEENKNNKQQNKAKEATLPSLMKLQPRDTKQEGVEESNTYDLVDENGNVDGSSEGVYVAKASENNGQSSPYTEEWGEVFDSTSVRIVREDQEAVDAKVMFLPIAISSSGKLEPKDEEEENKEKIEAHLSPINNIVDNIRKDITKLVQETDGEVRIYIDTNELDGISSDLFKKVVQQLESSQEDYVFSVKDRKKANLVISNLILTQGSYQEFYDGNFLQQINEIKGENQTGNLPA